MSASAKIISSLEYINVFCLVYYFLAFDLITTYQFSPFHLGTSTVIREEEEKEEEERKGGERLSELT